VTKVGIKLGIHEHRGGEDGGLKATYLENFERGHPLKILHYSRQKILLPFLLKTFGKNAKFWAKIAKFQGYFKENFVLFSKFFKNILSNFEVDFGNPCDYHKSVNFFKFL
jgi:hypothetical protein